MFPQPNGLSLKRIFLCALVLAFVARSKAQTVTNVIDRFDPSAIGANTYSTGTITNVWENWFGGALSGSLALGTMLGGFKCVLMANLNGQVNLIAAKPVITTAAKVSTNIIFTRAETSNYYVLPSTNLALSITSFTSWTRLLTN